MKNVIKYFGMALCALMALSCQKEAEISSYINIDRAAVEAEGDIATELTLHLKSDGRWYVYAPDWIEVKPASASQTGDMDVAVKILPNTDSFGDLLAPRADFVAFWSDNGAMTKLSVSQKGEAGLDVAGSYSLVHSTAEFDPSKGILIAVNDKGTYKAAMAFDASRDEDYSYLSFEAITPENDVVNMNTARLTWMLVPSGDGYALREPNGRYLVQSSSHDNFNSTSDLSKADKWSVEINPDGTAKILDLNVGKILQFSTEYATYGGYASLHDKCLFPYVFMDSKEASKEILQVGSEFVVDASCTSLSIPVTSDGDWKVRNHDEWIESCEKTSDSIELVFSENQSANDRTAVITVLGETKYVTVKLVQSRRISCISDLCAFISHGAKEYRMTMDSVVVSYVNGNNVFFRDDTAGLLMYQSGHTFKAGDIVSGEASGACTLYNGLPELSNITGVSVIGEVPEIEVDSLSFSDLVKSFDKYLSRPVFVRGVRFDKGVSPADKNGSISCGDAKLSALLQSTTFSITAGSEGDLTCIPTVSGGTNILGLWDKSHFVTSLTGGEITMASTKLLFAGVEEPVKLEASCNSGADVKFVSSDEAVVRVDREGNLSVAGVGSADITASAEAVEGYTAATAVCRIIVAEKGEGRRFEKVTSEPEDWSGKYLIVFSDMKAHSAIGGSDLVPTTGVLACNSDYIYNDAGIEKTSVVEIARVPGAADRKVYSLKLPDGCYLSFNLGEREEMCLETVSEYLFTFEWTEAGVKICGPDRNGEMRYLLDGGFKYRPYRWADNKKLPDLYRYESE